MSVQLRVPLMIHLNAHVHLRFKLTVTIELHLRYTLHILVRKNIQNDSIKCELKEALYVALEGAPKISL